MNFLNVLAIIFLQGQESASILLRSEKIYAVLTVVLVIFLSLVLFMLRTQGKLQKLEKQFEDKN